MLGKPRKVGRLSQVNTRCSERVFFNTISTEATFHSRLEQYIRASLTCERDVHAFQRIDPSLDLHLPFADTFRPAPRLFGPGMGLGTSQVTPRCRHTSTLCSIDAPRSRLAPVTPQVHDLRLAALPLRLVDFAELISANRAFW